MTISGLKCGKNRVTMADIANIAGVSRSAVSAVLNNRVESIRVGKETREKIEKIVRQTAFRSNAFGKALASGKSNLIGLVVKYISDSFMPSCVEAIEDVAESLGCGVLLMTTRDYGKTRQADVMNFVTGKWVDGIILASECEADQSTKAFMEQRKTPVVYLAHVPKNALTNSGTVCVNGTAIGTIGIQHLISKGHKHIACIGMSEWVKSGVNDGINLTPSNKKLDVEFWSCDFGSNNPMFEIFERWNKTIHRPTALFFNGDNFACDFINMAVRAGIRIPQDVALMGVNDIPEAAKAIYPLTTIRQPKYEQAEVACKLLFEMIDGKPGREIMLDPELIERETTRLGPNITSV